MLRLRRVIVRAAEIHEISAPIGLLADTRIERLPATRVLFLAPRELIERRLKPCLAPRLQAPVIPMHVPKERIELMPVEARLQIQLIELEPRLLLEARIEADDGQLLPQMIVDIALIHKENIVILAGRPSHHARAQILAIQGGKEPL